MRYEELNRAELEREYKKAMLHVAPNFAPIFEYLKRELQQNAFHGDYEKLKHHYNYLNELQILMENYNNAN